MTGCFCQKRASSSPIPARASATWELRLRSHTKNARPRIRHFNATHGEDMKFLATATLAVCLATMLNGQSSTYKLESKVLLPGGGGWDYVTVDAAGRRVYVSHATHVDVMDADSLKPIGTIDGTPGVHGIAVAPEVGRGFITAGGE